VALAFADSDDDDDDDAPLEPFEEAAVCSTARPPLILDAAAGPRRPKYCVGDFCSEARWRGGVIFGGGGREKGDWKGGSFADWLSAFF